MFHKITIEKNKYVVLLIVQRLVEVRQYRSCSKQFKLTLLQDLTFFWLLITGQ